MAGYGAPEVMLGIPYDEAIDMWYLGLVAVELSIEVPLCPGDMDYDVLKFIIDIRVSTRLCSGLQLVH